jgi:hypothetical protein
MRQWIVILICLVAVAFGTRSKNIQEHRLVGRWTEHWGIDTIHPETDVKYVDTITVETGKQGLSIWCHHDSAYVYDQIRLKGDSVFFRMENTGASTQGNPFYVNFRLKQVASDRLQGAIFNSQDETVSIVLQKLPLQ